jgi:pimeloyl-ACP methyl ester carboxylesterase
VHIGNGQHINTLIIDRDGKGPGGPATQQVSGPRHPHDLLQDLNELPPSELSQPHTVQVHDYGSDGMTSSTSNGPFASTAPQAAAGTSTAVLASTAPKKKNLLLLHGYGAGLGFYFKNFFSLSEVPDYRTFAIDWLGRVLSSRPPFPTKKSSGEIDDRPERAEAFFVDSLEEWRKAMKLDTLVICGHSLGGYLASCYALKYPERCEKLILLSPVGIPEPPDTISTADGRVVTVGGGSAPGWAARLWESNVTPFTLIRALGPWGKGLVTKYTTGRLGLDGEEGKEFADYMYAISVQKGSGEYALASLLSPGAWAKRPLAKRLNQIDPTIPITAIYGAQVSWLDCALE